MNAKKESDNLIPCPCCGTRMFTIQGGYEICDICNWEDDPLQFANPDYAGGANKQSLNHARKAWLTQKSNL